MALSRSDLVTVAAAATRLGVSAQRVRALIAAGDIDGVKVGNTWLVDPRSLADYRHQRNPTAGRALAPITAWAALCTAFGTNPNPDIAAIFGVIGQRAARIRNLAHRDGDDWRWLARRRANRQQMRVLPALLDDVREHPGVIAAGADATDRHNLTPDTNQYDAYVDPATAAELIDTYRLRPNPNPNITLRVINLNNRAQLAHITANPLPPLVCAVDMIESREPRIHSAGRELLASILQETT